MGSCKEAPWDWPTSHSAVDRDRVRSRSTHTHTQDRTSRSRVEGTRGYIGRAGRGTAHQTSVHHTNVLEQPW